MYMQFQVNVYIFLKVSQTKHQNCKATCWNSRHISWKMDWDLHSFWDFRYKSRSSKCFLSFIWVLDFPRTLWIKGNYVKIKHFLDNPSKIQWKLISRYPCSILLHINRNILCAVFRETVGIINIFHSSRKGKNLSDL